ncbi:MAG: non-homologous end-joining DNA ligase [Candidatus Krumholzibacteriota bacterium]|nr:non-homologous end-joining DNA ligase [Candidatus Krumholzibacteriota bacterium]
MGKILIDIYRNRPSQTIVSAYSVRGLDGATVSMPVSWDQLPLVGGIGDFHIRNTPDIVRAEGDQWEAIGAYAVDLHTHRKRKRARKAHPKSSKYKTPGQLEEYAEKRSFGKTSEPTTSTLSEGGSSFVVHRHHASRLHYDLRLEQGGALRSWAVPRGLPPRPGIKRLAVQTEDHPIEYLTFEGAIPKGEYGGGYMWIYGKGRYEITKEKKDGSFYFRLQSPGLTGEYRMFPTRGKEWILERVDRPQVDWLHENIEYMLATLETEVPGGDDWLYEVKWDGIRAMISVDEGEVRIRSRNHNDLTLAFPELSDSEQSFGVSCALFDAEIVCLDDDGRPVFKDVINRMRQTTESAAERGRRKHPAVCYVFDCLFLDGRPLVNEPLERRREWMVDAIRKDSAYRVSQALDEGQALFDAAVEAGLEGIMAKRRDSSYQVGKRSTSWLKVKSRRTIDCVIIGYTRGKGERVSTFGALQIAEAIDGKLTYLGKVGTGFDSRSLESVLSELKGVKRSKRAVKEKPLDEKNTVWIEPVLFCEVQYASRTPNGTLREPVFVHMRPDLEYPR